jgi:shikimate kinase
MFIFLIGMPGAGKTFWGRRLAEDYDLSFFDLDKQVELAEGKTITEIFLENGEEKFRHLEGIQLNEIIRKQNESAIVSCGGGILTHPGNRQLIIDFGCTIYLKAHLNTLLKNLEHEKQQRPLLRNVTTDPIKSLNELYEQRRGAYEAADFILEVEKLEIEDFKPIIEKCIKRR